VLVLVLVLVLVARRSPLAARHARDQSLRPSVLWESITSTSTAMLSTSTAKRQKNDVAKPSIGRF
jgi:hypothetical protein